MITLDPLSSISNDLTLPWPCTFLVRHIALNLSTKSSRLYDLRNHDLSLLNLILYNLLQSRIEATLLYVYKWLFYLVLFQVMRTNCILNFIVLCYWKLPSLFAGYYLCSRLMSCWELCEIFSHQSIEYLTWWFMWRILKLGSFNRSLKRKQCSLIRDHSPSLWLFKVHNLS